MTNPGSAIDDAHAGLGKNVDGRVEKNCEVRSKQKQTILEPNRPLNQYLDTIFLVKFLQWRCLPILEARFCNFLRDILAGLPLKRAPQMATFCWYSSGMLHPAEGIKINNQLRYGC
jgi:hypothetical protein